MPFSAVKQIPNFGQTPSKTMFNALRRGRSSRPLTRSFAELIPLKGRTKDSPTKAPPRPLRGTIDPPQQKSIVGVDDQSPSTAGPGIISPVRLGDRVPVREDHGLYAFFRQQVPEKGQILVGEAKYETVGGSMNMEVTNAGTFFYWFFY